MGKNEDFINAVKEENYANVQKILQKSQQKSGIFGGKKLNIDHEGSDGKTSLHHATILSNIDIIYLLLRHHANVNIKDEKGMTSLHYACLKGKLEAVEAILLNSSKSDSLTNQQANNGQTSLHISCEVGNFPISKYLLQFGGNPTIIDEMGKSPFDICAQYGRPEIMELILMTSYGTPIIDQFVAISMTSPSHPNMTSIPHPNMTSSSHPSLTSSTHRTSPLHIACVYGNSDVIKLLLRHHININWKDGNGNICLFDAILHGNTEIVELLIRSGIDVTTKNKLGMNACEYTKLLMKEGTSPHNYEKILQIITRDDDVNKYFTVRAIVDFNNILDSSQLSFVRGEIITVIDTPPSGNWIGKTSNGHIGSFPSSYVQHHHHIRHHHIRHQLAADSDDSGIHQYDEDEIPQHSIHVTSQTPHMMTSQPPHMMTPQSQTVMTSQPQNVMKSQPPHMMTSQPQNMMTSQPPHMMTPQSQTVMTPQPQNVMKSQPPHMMTSQPPHMMTSQPPHMMTSQSRGSSYVNISFPPPPPSPLGGAITSQPTIIINSKPINKHQHNNRYVINPSYDDVIIGQQPSLLRHHHVTSSPLRHHVRAQHINNPGYEDVILDQRSSPITIMPSQTNNNNNKAGRKLEMFSSSKKHQANQKHHQQNPVYKWLLGFHMEKYSNNFIEHGYDVTIIPHMTPDDLIALEITNPSHRKKITKHINKMVITSQYDDVMFTNVDDWLRHIELDDYRQHFIDNRIDTIEKASMVTWENLQEMNITKLGHQKKFQKFIEKLRPLVAEMKSATSSAAVVTSPPPIIDNEVRDEVCESATSKRISSFTGVDSQFNSELMAALSRRQRVISDVTNPSNDNTNPSTDVTTPKNDVTVEDEVFDEKSTHTNKFNVKLRRNHQPPRNGAIKTNATPPPLLLPISHPMSTGSLDRKIKKFPPPTPPRRTSSSSNSPRTKSGKYPVIVTSSASGDDVPNKNGHPVAHPRSTSVPTNDVTTSDGDVITSRVKPPVLPKKMTSSKPPIISKKPTITGSSHKPPHQVTLPVKPPVPVKSSSVELPVKPPVPHPVNPPVELPAELPIKQPVELPVKLPVPHTVKPPLATKPKLPVKTFKKVAPSSVDTTTEVRKFDLSAIDDVEMTSSSWPLPPPSFIDDLPPPPPPMTSSQDDHDDFIPITPPPPLVVENLPPIIDDPPVDDDVTGRTCFDDDEDMGTVKRRPHHPSTSSSLSENVELSTAEIDAKLQQFTSCDSSSSQQMDSNKYLEDISSMFDDLALQFDQMF